jgi:hypothetical protein
MYNILQFNLKGLFVQPVIIKYTELFISLVLNILVVVGMRILKNMCYSLLGRKHYRVSTGSFFYIGELCMSQHR